MAKDKTPEGPTRATGSRLEPEHVETLHAALRHAGLDGLRIAEIRLAPAREGVASELSCHAEQQPDGTWKIVCT